MKRPFLLVAAGIAALSLLALPAAAGNDHNVRGSITAVTATTISVQASNGVVTTCVLGKHSPAVIGFAQGDQVRMVCHGSGKGKSRAKLAKLRHLTLPAAPSADTSQVKFGGAITALSDTSVSLHDGDRDLTCTIDSTSPSTDGFKVGQHARVVCAGGTLVSISPVGTGDAGRAFNGTIASLDGGGVTVTTEHGPVTCTLGDGSPAVGDYQVGDHVLIGCNAHTLQLVYIKKLSGGNGDDGDGSGSGSSSSGGDGGTTTTSTPPPTHTKTSARGNVSALTDGSISVQTDGGTVSCTLDAESPALDGYAVGDNVTIGCLDGRLRGIEKH
jgi:hypothetical protein